MNDMDSALPPDLAARLTDELHPDERILWTGQPRLDLATRPAYFLVPFGVVFTGFSLVWILVAGTLTLGLLMPCGLPFIAVGIGLIASPAWLRSRARNTIYALTDQRALICEPGWFGRRTIRTYTASGLGRMSRTERPDGSGDLTFEEYVTYSTDEYGSHANRGRRGFMAINNVREVEEMIRRTLLTKD